MKKRQKRYLVLPSIVSFLLSFPIFFFITSFLAGFTTKLCFNGKVCRGGGVGGGVDEAKEKF